MKFVREILTILACLLVVALTAALAGPYFIDWTQHRAFIEERLGQAFGGSVHIAGNIDVKLLPAPRLVASDVNLQGAASIRAKSLRLEIAPMGFLRGDIRFTDVQIEAPDILLRLADDGAFVAPILPASFSGQIAFESITITKGRLRVAAPAARGELLLEDIAMDISAQSLAGPWRGAGAFRTGAQRVPFSFNTGVVEHDRLRLKAAMDASGDLPRSAFDGALIWSAGSQLMFDGLAKFSGAINTDGLKTIWDISGPVRADARSIVLEPLELRTGGDERTLTASGSARYIFGEKLADVSLETARLDVDYLAGKEQNASMSAAENLISPLLLGAREFPPAKISLKTSALTIGGETLADVSLGLTPMSGREALLTWRSGLPGRASLWLDGVIETGAASRFKGDMKFEARDMDRLSQWLKLIAPSLAAQLGVPLFQNFEWRGDVDLSAAGIFARDAFILADRSQFQGLVNYTRAIGVERARLVLDLNSPALDLDTIPDLTPLMRVASDADFSISLDARAVRLARVGQGMIDAGRILARVRRTGGEIDIEQFDIANLGGASFSTRGQLTNEAGQIDIKLDAERLVELGNLLQRIAPGLWSDALARRAVALSPAALTFSARASRSADSFDLSALNVSGIVRGTRVYGSVTPDRGDARQLTMRFTLANPQTPMLLRQLGADTIPLERLPEGRIEIEANGSVEAGFDVRASAGLAGTSLSYVGRIAALLPAADMRGEVRIVSADASPLLQVLALALPDASARAPVDISGVLAAREGRFSLADVSGSALGSRLAGTLDYGVPEPDKGPQKTLSGDLRLDQVSLESLASLVLGPRAPVRSNAIWPDFKFASALVDPPRVDVRISTEKFILPGGASGRDAKFRLVLAPGLAELSEAKLGLAGGQVSGRLTIRRDGANASVGGEVSFDGHFTGARDFSGQARARIEFAGAGASYGAIAASLAGRGEIELTDLRIAAADPSALGRIIADTQDMVDVVEAKIAAALAKELASADFRRVKLKHTLALAAGRLALTGAGPGDGHALSGSLDLRTLLIDAALALTAPAPEGWNARPPEAILRWQGPIGEPKRMLNVAALANGMGARVIEREAARIEMLEFDARERAAFNRRSRAIEFLQQRETEIAAYHAAQERLVNEERFKGEEEARRKLLDEQRAAVRKAAADAEREKREKERASRGQIVREPNAGAPLQLAPQKPAVPQVRSPASRQPEPLSDPAAAGRY